MEYWIIQIKPFSPKKRNEKHCSEFSEGLYPEQPFRHGVEYR